MSPTSTGLPFPAVDRILIKGKGSRKRVWFFRRANVFSRRKVE